MHIIHHGNDQPHFRAEGLSLRAPPLDLDDLANPQQFTNTGDIEERWPSWSPDDSSIVLKSSGSGKAKKTTGYEILSVDGSDRDKIANAGNGAPVWRR